MASGDAESQLIGLESRLQAVEGVESIELDLSDHGLEGITVRLAEGADEVTVLEGIRRLLVAYGTKGRGLLAANGKAAVEEAAKPDSVDATDEIDEIDHEVIDIDQAESEILAPPEVSVSGDATRARGRTQSGVEVELSVAPAGENTASVRLTWGERTVRRQIPTSARAIVQAAIDCAGELVGRDPISVIGMNLSAIEGTRVLTVIAGNHGAVPRVCTVSVVEGNWPAALLTVLLEIVGEKTASV